MSLNEQALKRKKEKRLPELNESTVILPGAFIVRDRSVDVGRYTHTHIYIYIYAHVYT